MNSDYEFVINMYKSTTWILSSDHRTFNKYRFNPRIFHRKIFDIPLIRINPRFHLISIQREKRINPVVGEET